uniref:VWFA domain-containing protein n=1 Tax=Acrobeloides nanus TaxID=290746 RepID=A0A914DGF6_9BILA
MVTSNSTVSHHTMANTRWLIANFDLGVVPTSTTPLQGNLITGNQTVYGIEGVMEAYKICLKNCTIYGPTNFAPTINEAAKKASSFPQDGSRYQILLVITDGDICDMMDTKKAIIEASELPLSIIIVGVGTAEFDRMEELDSDDKLLSYNGLVAKRDIVQFVPFRKFLPNLSGNQRVQEIQRIQDELAREVLAEIPKQVISYMKWHKIEPKLPTMEKENDFEFLDFNVRSCSPPPSYNEAINKENVRSLNNRIVPTAPDEQ